VSDDVVTRTVYGCGNKVVTTKTKPKSGATKVKVKVISGVKPRKARKPK
jgi:hypothetical protein